MADFPAGVYSPRTKANKNGVVYDADKETIGYAEDVTKLDAEVVAVETELGADPKGAKVSVVARLNDVDTAISGKQATLTFGIADNNAVEIDDADAENGDYAKFTADGIRGKSVAEVRSDLNVLYQKSVVKTADETVNNSSTVQDDDELLIAVGANEKWKLEVIMSYSAHADADGKVTFSGPSGSAAVWSGTDAGGNIGRALASEKQLLGYGITSQRITVLQGYFTTGATPGNIQLRWAQWAAHASDMKVYAGSNIIATRLS